MLIDSSQRKKLKALAHHLKPVVNIGKEGVSDGVIHSISEKLEKNELIKIKFSHPSQSSEAEKVISTFLNPSYRKERREGFCQHAFPKSSSLNLFSNIP